MSKLIGENARTAAVTNLEIDLDIDQYFMDHLSLSYEDAVMLHKRYYTEYGLAIEGLARHHKVDPLEYNAKVDDALPLEDVLKPDAQLRKLLEDLDRSKVRPWLFTNAHFTHAERCVRLLGIDDLFEGMSYCDYAAPVLVCKPHKLAFDKAEAAAGAPSSEQCYFVDDSALNCRHAEARGWNVAHLVEEGYPLLDEPACKRTVRHLEELRTIFPQLFKSKIGQSAVL